MKIELRNVKHAAFASEETSCFEATVWIDGKREGTVSNEGRGGCNSYHPWKLQDLLEDYAKTLPERTFPADLGGGKYQPDADTMIGDLFGDVMIAKDLRRALGKRILFMRGTDVRQTGAIGKDAVATLLAKPELLAEQLKVEPAEILNLMPFERAVELYRGAVA